MTATSAAGGPNTGPLIVTGEQAGRLRLTALKLELYGRTGGSDRSISATAGAAVGQEVRAQGGTSMTQRHVGAVGPSIGAAVCSALLLIGIGVESARADHTFNVTGLSGSAFGYFGNVGFFGRPPATRGPSPTVTLGPQGSAAPLTASASTGLVQYDVVTLFSSGALSVSTQGTTGPDGSATSATNITNVNTSGQELFTAGNVASTCTASAAGHTGATTITGGTLQTSEGDPDVDGDETVVAIPERPAANTTYTGTIESAGESFRYVFNEQIVNSDGSLTVNAAHHYLLGPAAVGDVAIGHSRCGVTATPTPHDTTAPETTIDSGPAATASPGFAFSSSEPGSTFECKLDGPGTTTGSYTACTSPTSYTNLAAGNYTFAVRAIDAANNVDATPATRTFTVSSASSTPPARRPAPPPPPPPPPADAVSFQLSPKSLRVSKTGRFEYSFRATPLRVGTISLKSTKKVRIGSTKRFVTLAARSFTAPSARTVKVKFKLTSKSLKALKRLEKVRFNVVVKLGAKTFATTLTLKAPRRHRSSSR